MPEDYGLGCRVSHLEGKRILLMPGHVNNCYSQGAKGLVYPGVRLYAQEEEIVLDIAVRTLGRVQAAGAEVCFGHGSFSRKKKLAEVFHPDLSLEIHANAPGAGTPGAEAIRGMEIWTMGDSTSLQAAGILFSSLRRFVDLPPHGDYPGEANDGLHDVVAEGNTRRALFDAIKTRPLLLLEVGFLTNLDDCSYLVDGSNQDKIATGIMQGLRGFFSGSTSGRDTPGTGTGRSPGTDPSGNHEEGG